MTSCHVWLRPTAAGAPAPLGVVERARWERLRAAGDRDRTATAHHLLREAAAWWLGVEPGSLELVRRCPRCGAVDHGPVRVVSPAGRSVAASISHSGSLVAVALSAAPAVGVDVEQVGPDVPDLASLALSRREQAEHARVGTAHDLLVRWVRKEAVLKAAGVGLAGDLRALRVSRPSRPARVLSWPRRERPAGTGGVRLADVQTPDSFVGAVAVLTEPPTFTSTFAITGPTRGRRLQVHLHP